MDACGLPPCQARFRHADGDALSALRALCAFEAAGESDAFCAQHFLHARNLREAADLHRQLLRVLSSSSSSTSGAAAGGDGRGPPKARQQPDAGFGAASGGLGGELADEARRLGGAGGMLAAVREAPSERVLALLRRAIAAGWADQVARRVRTAEYLQQLSEGRCVRACVLCVRACCVCGAVLQWCVPVRAWVAVLHWCARVGTHLFGAGVCRAGVQAKADSMRAGMTHVMPSCACSRTQ